MALLFYQTGFLAYAVLPEGYSVGDKLKFSLSAVGLDRSAALFNGNALSLREIAEGSFVFNIEIWPAKGAQICRAAGTYGILLGKRNGFVTLKLRSG